MKRGWIQLNELRLALVDFGGEGKPGLLLLHGLFGRATTWQSTASWLTPHFHVVALDQRGHGWSDKPERAYTRKHYVQDAAEAIRALNLAPAVVIGHSMGALNAWVLAAQCPELVQALVLEDMTAATASLDAGESVRRWLASWPLPFPSLAAVKEFFDRDEPNEGNYFQEIMREQPDGYVPLFQPEHMVQTSNGVHDRDYWEELEQVQCPALVVKGSESESVREELQEMARRLPHGQYAEVAGAFHVVHYNQPEAWRSAVEPFVLGL